MYDLNLPSKKTSTDIPVRYRNDIPISKYDDRVEVKNDDCHLYCTIKKIAMDDSGSNYSVTADTAKTAGTLTVTEEPLYFVEKLKVSVFFYYYSY